VQSPSSEPKKNPRKKLPPLYLLPASAGFLFSVLFSRKGAGDSDIQTATRRHIPEELGRLGPGQM
jgi:hypothetical protein